MVLQSKYLTSLFLIALSLSVHPIHGRGRLKKDAEPASDREADAIRKSFESLDIDVDHIPPSIKHVSLPPVHLSSDGVEFEIPDEVGAKLFAHEQRDVLKGACKKAYEAYEDGTRVESMKTVLGQEAYDMVVEAILYDYLHGDCDWVDNYFGQIIGEWAYVPKEHAGIFESISSRGSLASEAIGYFSYWLQNEANQGRAIYPMDNVLAWKIQVAEAFSKLKKVHSLKKAGPGKLGKLKCERVCPVNFFREPKNDEVNFQDESEDLMDDEDADEKGKRVDDVVEFISHREQSDVSGPSTRKERDPDWEPDPTGYTIQITMEVDVCIGICVKIGAGLSWNAITEEEYVHWSYGMGSLDSHSAKQDVRLRVAHFCESTIAFGNIWDVGYVTDRKTAYNHMYTEDFGEFLGISYDTGYLHEYEPDKWDESTRHHFSWHHTKRLARRALSASVRKNRNIQKLQEEGVPDSEIVALQGDSEENEGEEGKEGDQEVVFQALEEDGEGKEEEAYKLGAKVDTGKEASNFSLNMALIALTMFLVIGFVYWWCVMRPEKMRMRLHRKATEKTPLLAKGMSGVSHGPVVAGEVQFV